MDFVLVMWRKPLLSSQMMSAAAVYVKVRGGERLDEVQRDVERIYPRAICRYGVCEIAGGYDYSELLVPEMIVRQQLPKERLTCSYLNEILVFGTCLEHVYKPKTVPRSRVSKPCLDDRLR